jgi:hypothetical protein
MLRVGEITSYSTAGGIGSTKQMSRLRTAKYKLTSLGKNSQTHASTAIKDSNF